MTRPPITYPCDLSDLVLFADAAAALDDYKPPAGPDRDRIVRLSERLHCTVERIAGPHVDLIYGKDEAEEAPC